MSETSLREAENLIAEIRADNGGISYEERERTPAGVLRALANVRRKLGAATRTLATNLYSKDTRFIYELIQNAEDNQYNNLSDGEVPFVRFSLFPDRIIVDSNEDGFSDRDVRAICSVGESVKSNTQGYIGEKGIGFKSVFKIASKVHIQSGPFSFFFEYTGDSEDDGLGMVTPMWAKHEHLPDNVHTRMTLWLLDPGTFDIRAQELQNIPKTLLLSIRRLKSLELNIHSRDTKMCSILYNFFEDYQDKLDCILQRRITNRENIEATYRFKVFRSTVKDLPKDDARKNIHSADIVLAFPVDKMMTPIIEDQNVCAFLPLRQVGFKFLVQSDFVTQASREDVVDSPRNRALLNGVTNTFRDAVLYFSEHPQLRFSWMRYLPSAQSVRDEFWKTTVSGIQALLTREQILVSISDQRDYPSKLRRLGPDYLDKNGSPLFPDIQPRICSEYLSHQYTQADFESLKCLGCEEYGMIQLLHRIEVDLASLNSRYRMMDPGDDWHTRVCRLLRVALQTHLENLQSLPLIPLTDSSWISMGQQLIYFPSSGNFPVPRDLKILLVHPNAIANKSRKKFLTELGVQPCNEKKVIELIVGRYNRRPTVTLANSCDHVAYLYWNLPNHQRTFNENMWLMDQSGTIAYPRGAKRRHIYILNTNDRYGPYELLQNSEPHVAAHPVSFLNQDYLKMAPKGSQHLEESFLAWLELSVGVHRALQLLDVSGTEISSEFKYVMRHRPEKLVGLLLHNWRQYKDIIELFAHEVSKCPVRCEDGNCHPIGQTFIPSFNLKKIVKKLAVPNFPFLLIDPASPNEDVESCKALSELLVGVEDTLFFYLRCLDLIASASYDRPGEVAVESITELYQSIDSKCSSQACGILIRSRRLLAGSRIFIPGNSSFRAAWARLEDCRWSSPECLEHLFSLGKVPQFQNLEVFFQKTLKVRNANTDDALRELRIMKSAKEASLNKLIALYKYVSDEIGKNSITENPKSVFEEECLIYVPKDCLWTPPSVCVWAKDQFVLPGKSPLETPYESLKEFFVKTLGISKPDVNMHVKALRKLSSTKPELQLIKDRIKLFSSMQPSSDDLSPLHGAKIFPVKNPIGEVSLTSSQADFAITDRRVYYDAFKGKIAFLDFTLEEVLAFEGFLFSFGMKNRFLSSLVQEQTTFYQSQRISALTQKMRSKAHGILRCAVHYSSPKAWNNVNPLYSCLLRMNVHNCKAITKSMIITQASESIHHDGEEARFHLKVSDRVLDLYVPSNVTQQALCFLHEIPEGLLKFLKIHNKEAKSVMCKIVNAESVEMIDTLLLELGISEVNCDVPEFPWGEHAEREAPATRSFVSQEPFERPHANTLFPSTDRAEKNSCESITDSELTAIPTSKPRFPRFVNYLGKATRVPTSSVSMARPQPLDLTRASEQKVDPFISAAELPEPTEPTATTAPVGCNTFIALLDFVIEAAKRTSFYPERGSKISAPRTSLQASSGIDPILAIPSSGRARKVGAAGELFVFEILAREHPGISRENWKSTIRNEVSVHPMYRDMKPWRRAETSDIVVDDANGAHALSLARLIFGRKELDAIAGDARLNIEVKTTTGECKEPFFMSQSQYQRMLDVPRPTMGRRVKELFIIARVFNLGQEKMGLRLFPDVQGAQESGELEFSVDRWTVRSKAL